MRGVVSRVSAWWAAFWLRLLFWLSSWVPWLPRTLKPVSVRMAWATSGSLRSAARANARRLLGGEPSARESRRYGRRVVGRFYDAVLEFGTNRASGADELAARVEQVEGQEAYEAARRLGRGAVLVTAHLGSFETAIGLLRRTEPRIHVVFQRDYFALFEQLRSRQRARLGVIEAPVDEGLAMWVGLRDALESDGVVLLQGDRCMPGQRGVSVPFLGGHLRVPTGPARLARLTSSPIIPVFAINTSGDRVRVVLTEPIHPADHPGARPGKADPMIEILASRIESVVSEFPDQWMCLHPVLVEDQDA